MTRRILAQRVKTGAFLSTDVPLLDGGATRELSGPGGIAGTIEPVTRTLLGPDGLPLLREWSTALYAEDANGEITGAGIVTRIVENDGGLVVEAPGFSTYPHGILHDKTHVAEVEDDALDVYRYLWDYVQSFPDGDLGVTVDGLKSGATVETREEHTKRPGKDGASLIVEKIKPYRLPWWEYRDCGQEMDSLLEVASADYTERHQWNGDHTAITHHINLGVPRLGKKRDDLRFVEGENVIAALGLVIDGDDFAQTIYGVGRGEGRKMKHSHVAHRDDRLRRTALVTDKNAWQDRIDRLTRREFQRRNDTRGFETVVIRDHANARIPNIHPGDDVLVEANLDWHGRVRLWVRVLSIEASLTNDTAALRVARSDMFR